MKCVLVTGANGFVGRHLSAELLERGWRVRGAVRRPESLRDLPEGVEGSLVTDAGAETDWTQSLSGTDYVVHLVARTHVLQDQASDPLEAYRRVNVQGTDGIASACLRAGVRRLVYLSSIKAVGEGSNEPYSELTPCNPEDAYGRSKLEAEELLRQAYGGSALETVILRPPLVFGPGVKGNLLRLLKAVDKGFPLPLAMVRNHRSMIYVRNLATAIVDALQHPSAAYQTYHVADPTPLSTSDLIDRLAHLMGKTSRLWPIPTGLMRAGGFLLRREAEIDRLLGSLTVDSSKIERDLGWRSRYSLDEGLTDTVTWFRQTSRK